MTLVTDLALYKDGATGDMYYRNASGLLVKVTGTQTTGYVPTKQADGSIAWAAASGGSSRLTPAIVQRASLRNDGTLALASAPTVGNLLVWVFAGFTGSEATYAPTGFTKINAYDSDGNNRVALWKRVVVSGDTGSYSLTATDNQGCTLYEISNASSVLAIQGGAMSSFFSGTSFTLPVPDSPYEGVNFRFLAFEQDGTGYYTITAATGLTTDYLASSGGNHAGAVIALSDAFSGSVAGSVGSTPSAPAYGLWVVIGKKA